MAPERIALVTTPDGYWGGEEAGLVVITIAGPEQLPGALRLLFAGGEFAVVAVSEEAAAGLDAELGVLIDAAPAQVSVILVPAPGARTVAGLARLRERFAAALGVDVWKMAAQKAGADV